MPLSVPSGPYAISTLTLEIPARQPQSFASHIFRIQGKEVFRHQTTLVTLFYPTSAAAGEAGKKPKDGLDWLPHPKWKSMEGLVKYAGLNRYFAYPAVFILPYTAKLPYINSAPLAKHAPGKLSTPENGEASSSTPSDSSTFPTAIFSHGLAGSRTTYSQYLAELASRGIVVASVEHRDGSGPSTTIRPSKDGKEETLTYFKHSELDKGEDGKDLADIWDMRKAQLRIRQAEVLDAVDILSRLHAGEGEELTASSTLPVDAKSRLQDWQGRLNLEKIWALGHSFGGATCIELLRKKESPFQHALVLDPWIEVIEKAGSTSQPLQRPLFVVNSEFFTVWRSHFRQLRELVQESYRNSGRGWLLTMTKTAHTDFSDFPLLMHRFFKNKSGVSPQSIIDLFTQASVMEIEGDFDKSRLNFTVRDEAAGEIENRDLGKGGEIVWHPLSDGDDAGADARL